MRDGEDERQGIFDRLADHSTFTGTHKARFDSDGRGLGRSGRMDPHERVADLGAMVNRTRPRTETDSPMYCGGATQPQMMRICPPLPNRLQHLICEFLVMLNVRRHYLLEHA